MICKSCKRELPDDALLCCYCGVKQVRPRQKTRTHGNGQGTVFRDKKTGKWVARVIIGWRLDENGQLRAITKSKSGLRTSNEARAVIPKLQAMSIAPPPDVTFTELYKRWHDVYDVRVTKSTMDCYRAAYKYCAHLYGMRFADIKGDDLQACIDGCSAGKRTKENIKAFMSLMYKYAMHNDIVSRNRAETLYTGNGVKGTRPAFTREELERIRQAVDTVPYADYVYCMIYLGYRPGEMLTLEKSAYDAAHNCLIGGSKTEAGRDRIVTISPKIAPLIERQLRTPGSYLFPRHCDHQKLSENYFRKYCFQPAMRALGISGRVPYSCRHTFANLLKDVIGSDTDKSSLMGHANAAMTKYYQSADYESLRKLTDMI